MINLSTTGDVGNTNCENVTGDTAIQATAKIISLFLLGAFGMFGNIFVIVLAACYTARKNLHHLIINMAVSNGIVILMGTLIFMSGLFGFKLVGADSRFNIACKTVMFLYSTSSITSLLTMLITSIEKFKVASTIQIIERYSSRQRLGTVLISWLVTMVLSMNIIVYGEYNNSLCRLNWTVTSIGFYVSVFLVSVVCYVVICALSMLTLRRLSKRCAQVEGNLSNEQRELRKKRLTSVTKMILASLLLYSSCYLPLTIFSVSNIVAEANGYMLINYNQSCIDWTGLLFFLFTFLPIFNSSISPYIYIALLPDFRKAAWELMCQKIANIRRISPDISMTPPPSTSTTKSSIKTTTSSVPHATQTTKFWKEFGRV